MISIIGFSNNFTSFYFKRKASLCLINVDYFCDCMLATITTNINSFLNYIFSHLNLKHKVDHSHIVENIGRSVTSSWRNGFASQLYAYLIQIGLQSPHREEHTRTWIKERVYKQEDRYFKWFLISQIAQSFAKNLPWELPMSYNYRKNVPYKIKKGVCLPWLGNIQYFYS